MPSLPFYASSEDFRLLLNQLNETKELAFLVSAGSGKWVAQKTLGALKPGRTCLWHIGSGPLPLVQPCPQPDGLIANPFEPWTELRAGADPSTPYFGAGHPGVFQLDLRGEELSRHGRPIIGLSSFGWIGNHYRIIGNTAMPQTEIVWKALRRWVSKSARKVPRGGPTQSTPPEIWTFPGAELAFSRGIDGGNN